MFKFFLWGRSSSKDLTLAGCMISMDLGDSMICCESNILSKAKPVHRTKNSCWEISTLSQPYLQGKSKSQSWLLRVPCKVRTSNQSILMEINPEHYLEWLMLKLKLQYFDHQMQTAYSLEKALILGKIESRRREWQRIRWLDGIFDSKDMNLGKLQETVKDRGDWRWWGTGKPSML